MDETIYVILKVLFVFALEVWFSTNNFYISYIYNQNVNISNNTWVPCKVSGLHLLGKRSEVFMIP